MSPERAKKYGQWTGPFKVMALITLGNEVIIGWNQEKSDPKWTRQGSLGSTYASVHAELHALTLARDWDLRKARVRVMRWDRKGRLTMAKPCPYCQSKLEEMGIKPKNISWTDWNGEWNHD